MSWLDALADRVSAVVNGAARDRSLAREIAHHLELETERQRRAGYPPEVARRRALALFGNPTRVTDATRDARGGQSMEGSMQDLRWACRSLRKSAGFTALALATLALGIGATTAAYAVFDTVLLRPLPYRDANRLVLIRERTASGATIPPSYPNFADWRAQAGAFDGVASAMFPYSTTASPSPTSDEPMRVRAMGVSRRFFATLGVRLAAGREFADAENAVGGPLVVMVSYEFWKTAMGGRLPLGSIRAGDDLEPVVGVLPPDFQFISPADLYVPHERGPGTVRSAHNYLVVARLAHGVTIDAARAAMTTLSRRLHDEYGNDTQAVDADVRPLRDYLVSNFRGVLAVVLGSAAMVLLIACVNLLSAQLARGWVREREMAVRAALGASRSRIIRQLCLESGVLVATGAALGVGLAFTLTAAIKRVGVGLVPRLVELSIDGRVLAVVGGAASLTVLVVGLYPALRLSRGGGDGLLRTSRGTASTVRATLWRALVGFEIALAVMLTTGSALLARTLHNILTAPTGLDTRGVVYASFSPSKGDLARLDEVGADLSHLPGASGAAFTSELPFNWGSQSAPVRRPGDPIDHDWRAFAGFRLVTPGYFEVLHQRIRIGRSFTTSDRAGSLPVAIVTPGIAAKLWPGLDPIGKLVSTNYLADDWLTVVGVADEASSWNMARGDQNELFVPVAQHPKSINSELSAVIRARDPAAPAPVMQSARARLHDLAPRSPAQIGTLDDRIARTASDRRFAMLALVAFGTIALALAGIGIYGVVWYIVTTRTREVGIRMALGATAGRVQRQFLGGALGMGLGGVMAGVGGGLLATRFLQATLYGVSRLDPAAFAAAACLALCVALVGAYVPARRSSRIDPMTAIRAAE